MRRLTALLALGALLAGCATPTLRVRCYQALVGYSAVQAGVQAYLETPYALDAPVEVLDGIERWEPVAAQGLLRGCGLVAGHPGSETRAEIVERELAAAEVAIRRLVESYSSPAAYPEVSP